MIFTGEKNFTMNMNRIIDKSLDNYIKMITYWRIS